MSAALTPTDLAVRRAILDTFVQARIPTRIGVMQQLGLEYAEVSASYTALAATHVIVPHPETGEVWMAMPFSGVPTDVPVMVEGRMVWANCTWDAFGIAAALATDVSFVSPCPATKAPIAAGVRRGVAFAAPGAVAHIGVPAPRWWDDIGFT